MIRQPWPHWLHLATSCLGKTSIRLKQTKHLKIWLCFSVVTLVTSLLEKSPSLRNTDAYGLEN